MRRAAALLVLLLLALIIPAHARVSDRFCVVPVADSATEDGQRIVSHALMVPGVSRPIIYPAQGRKGLWTIDEERRLVRMPGPALPDGDPSRYAQDPKTGRIVAMGTRSGLFRLAPEGPRFELIQPVNNHPLGHLFEIRFSARLDGLVLFDANGVFLLTRENKVVPVPVPPVARVGDEYDLPTFDGRLALVGRDVVMRYDDGERVELIRLPTGESILGVELGRGGTSAIIRTETFSHTVSLPRHRTWRSRYGLGRVEAEALARVPRKDLGDFVWRVDAPSIGKALLFSERGVYELSQDGRTAVALPLRFDARETPIRSVGELPASRAVIIFTTANVYAMDQHGEVTIIPGGDQVGPAHHHNKGVIPGRDEMLVAGARALYLVVDRARSGDAVCGSR